MPFEFRPTTLPGVVLVEAAVFPDGRGFLLETHKRSAFAAAGIHAEFVQENYSLSVRGTLRGLHFQREPAAQGKLVRVLRGEVFDVAVDVRRDSPTFARWVGVNLSGRNHRAMFIPPGYAHGFCVVSDEAEVLYQMTAEYAPELEAGVAWNDPLLGIDWPVASPRLSPRDTSWPPLSQLR